MKNVQALKYQTLSIDGAYKVFEELSIELKAHLDSLDKILANSLNILNDQLIGKRLDPISSMINKTIN